MNIYVGYDSRNRGQEFAYEVCKRSILNNNTSRPPANWASVIPLKLEDLRCNNLYWRKDDPKQSTEFTYSRYLVPHLNRYEGYAVFCDSDFLWQCDVSELLSFIDENKAVSCVQHSYTECESSTKMDGLAQEWYPRKNWSSLMVFNCSHPDCKNLDLEAVNTRSPKYLHRMEWTSDKNIGSIPIDYNYLVVYYDNVDSPRALHFTDGGPWHKDYRDVQYGDKWLGYLDSSEAEALNEFLERED